MTKYDFSLTDYQLGLAEGKYTPPKVLCPYYEVDPKLYTSCGTTNRRRFNLSESFEELRKRTGPKYFGQIYPLQTRTLSYSSRVFPSYRFILPEVMTEDWLAIVDWGKFQRDHVLHQPLCGYVVLKLLDAKSGLYLSNTMPLLDTCVNQIMDWEKTEYIRDFLLDCGMKRNNPILSRKSPIARIVWRQFFREAAYIAAVFHDLGYPWQYIGRMQDNLDGMNTSSLKQNQSVEKIIDQFSDRMLFHALSGYKKIDKASPSTWRQKFVELVNTALANTHGMPGALGFLHLNDRIRRYPPTAQSPMRLLCVEWVAVAIMMHDMLKMYWGNSSTSAAPQNQFLKVSFDRDPLSSMMTLVDVIQEFERPTVVYGADNGKVTLKYSKACKATELEINSGILTLRYKMVNEKMRAVKRKSLVKESHDYFDPQYGYLDLKSIGINEVKLAVC